MLVNPVGGTLSNVLKNNLRNFFCCYLCLTHHQMLLNAYFLRKLFFEHYYHCFTSKKIIPFRKKKIIIRIENQPSVQRYAPHNRYSCPKLNQWSKHIPLPRASYAYSWAEITPPPINCIEAKFGFSPWIHFHCFL